jgi:hypothetical protein
MALCPVNLRRRIEMESALRTRPILGTVPVFVLRSKALQSIFIDNDDINYLYWYIINMRGSKIL